MLDRRRFLLNSGLMAAAAGAFAARPAAGAVPSTTLLLEDQLKLAARHLDRLVDAQGRTYFDVFLEHPAAAVTDWPDFVDLPSRYWEGCLLAGSALSTSVPSRGRLANWLFAKIEDDGLAYRPAGPLSSHIAELFDQSRLFYALTSAVMLNPDDASARRRLVALADGLARKSTRTGDYAYIDKIDTYFGGTLIRPMLQAGLALNRPDLIELAAAFARAIVDHSDSFAADGAFSGHVHTALGSTAGILAVGIKTGDRHLVERARTVFEYARGLCTDFGWVPELAQRQDDVIACETCALMDYLDAALLLARHVDPSYYDVVEKAARNHLWESQIRDAAWLGAAGSDEDGVIRTDLPNRLVGSYCGWSAPHCSLAYHEPLSTRWVKTEALRSRFLNKTRFQQNCCAGGGLRAVYQVWSNIITEEAGQLSVNLSLDRSTPQLAVTSYVPFEGLVRLTVKQNCRLRWRRPAYCAPADVRVKVTGARLAAEPREQFLSFGNVPAGAVIELRFPLPERHSSVTIGNPGHQHYRFDVDWRGDTVLAIRPDPANPADAFTKLAKQRVTAYYNRQGPGPLYQRSSWTAGLKLKPAPSNVAATAVDWYRL
jgi:hypothetical protein